MKIDRLTPNKAILEELGERLARIRKQQRHSQEALAREAGIGVATLRRIEDGKDGQLGSWIKILKALQMNAAIDGLLPESFGSPMDQALRERKSKRTRVRRSNNPPTPGSDFAWGEERP